MNAHVAVSADAFTRLMDWPIRHLPGSGWAQLLLLWVCLLLLTACGTQSSLYRAGLDSVERQQREIAAAQTQRDQAQALALQACAGLADAGAIGVCMLGVGNAALAARVGTGSQSVVAPQPLPRSGAELLVDLGKGVLPPLINGFVALGQSEDSKDVSIAQSNNLYGYLRQTSSDTATTAQTALAGSAQVATFIADASARGSEAWAAAAPELRPSISITGDGNVMGDRNALDQSDTSGLRVAGDSNALDLSSTAGDRYEQSGENNRQRSDGPYTQDLQCTLISSGAPGAPGGDGGNSGGTTGPGGTGAPGGAGGAGTGILRCAPSNGG